MPAAPPAQVNVRTGIIYYALRLIGQAQRAGVGPSTDEIADVLGALNAMLDSWNTERRIVWAMVANDKVLNASQAVYKIGDSTFGAVDINYPRPSRIDAASMVITTSVPNIELPMGKLEWDDWQRLPVKSTPATFATRYYYDRAEPIGNISLYPVPNTANTLRLYLWQTLTTFAAATENVYLPQGYLRAIRYNLAVEIADMFPGAALKQATVNIARESKANIKTINQPPMSMDCDPAAMAGSGGRYNFYTDKSHH